MTPLRTYLQSISARYDAQRTRRKTQDDVPRGCPLNRQIHIYRRFAAGAEDENGTIQVYCELSSVMKLINLLVAK